jgi:hypothetical protein
MKNAVKYAVIKLFHTPVNRGKESTSTENYKHLN